MKSSLGFPVLPSVSCLYRDLSQPAPSSHRAVVCLCFFVLMLTGGIGQALELEKPVDGPYGGKARITLVNGDELIGDITAVANAQNGLSSILYHKDGKHRIPAEDVQALEVRKKKIEKIRPGFLMRGFPGGGLETRPTKRLKAIDKQFGTDSEGEYWGKVVPEQDEQRHFIAMGQGNEVRLLQVLNGAFDQRIQVFRKPIPIAGSFLDMEKERFWVIKDGGAPMLVDRKRYVTAFVALFGDCDVTAGYSKKERKFRHFAEHLFVYDRHCPAPTP